MNNARSFYTAELWRDGKASPFACASRNKVMPAPGRDGHGQYLITTKSARHRTRNTTIGCSQCANVEQTFAIASA
jgi:hypothetical protein